MFSSLISLTIGFTLDLIIGDPHGFPHPVIFIGRLIAFLEKYLRKIFPKTALGENIAGAVLWLLVVVISTLIPASILIFSYHLNLWFGIIIESIMCWQLLATKSLKDESMKVYSALKTGDINQSRKAVSMIVGRDTASLDDAAITRATVETIAENTSDGIIAPMLFIAIGGAPLGFLYKAVNTMDSMLGYVEMPYKNIGFIPAKLDDVFNYIPARLSACLMLLAGALLKLNVQNGWKIFKRDRYNHASPNAAQTESICAGLLDIRLAGDAYYHGVLHKKKYIGNDNKKIHHQDIVKSVKLLYVTAALGLLVCAIIKIALLK